MKNKLKPYLDKVTTKVKAGFSWLGKKTRPTREKIAKPVTKWGRVFERNFYATTHIVRIFRKTLAIAGIFAVAGLAFGSITIAAFLSSVKAASMVAGITIGREGVTRLFTDKKQVTWKNEIGQEVVGTKIQKQKLTATQVQINRLTDKFNSVSGPTDYQKQKLKIIAQEMQELAKEVTIKSAPTGIAKDRYVFAVSKRDWKPLT